VIDLRTKTTDELVELLKTLPVAEWNEAHTAARKESGYSWQANLDGANLNGAILYGANLDGANLDGANLYGASLDGANLYGARLDGQVLQVSPVAGYRVALFGADNNAGHVIQAGCWTGTLDKALDRLAEEGEDSPENVAEVEAFVVYAEAVMKSWPQTKAVTG